MEEFKVENFDYEYNTFLDISSGELTTINEKKCIVLDYEQFEKMKSTVKDLYNELANSNRDFNRKYIEEIKLRSKYNNLINKLEYKKSRLHRYKQYYRRHPIDTMEKDRIDREEENN